MLRTWLQPWSDSVKNGLVQLFCHNFLLSGCTVVGTLAPIWTFHFNLKPRMDKLCLSWVSNDSSFTLYFIHWMKTDRIGNSEGISSSSLQCLCFNIVFFPVYTQLVVLTFYHNIWRIRKQTPYLGFIHQGWKR